MLSYLMPEISAISGFLFGFVCWISCFLLPSPMADWLDRQRVLVRLNSTGLKIVACVVFIFLFGSTVILLMLYPLYGFIFFGGIDEFYSNIKISFISSFIGFLFILFLRYLAKRAIMNS
jgi:hypothetical protein